MVKCLSPTTVIFILHVICVNNAQGRNYCTKYCMTSPVTNVITWYGKSQRTIPHSLHSFFFLLVQPSSGCIRAKTKLPPWECFHGFSLSHRWDLYWLCLVPLTVVVVHCEWGVRWMTCWDRSKRWHSCKPLINKQLECGKVTFSSIAHNNCSCTVQAQCPIMNYKMYLKLYSNLKHYTVPLDLFHILLCYSFFSKM